MEPQAPRSHGTPTPHARSALSPANPTNFAKVGCLGLPIVGREYLLLVVKDQQQVVRLVRQALLDDVEVVALPRLAQLVRLVPAEHLLHFRQGRSLGGLEVGVDGGQDCVHGLAFGAVLVMDHGALGAEGVQGAVVQHPTAAADLQVLVPIVMPQEVDVLLQRLDVVRGALGCGGRRWRRVRVASCSASRPSAAFLLRLLLHLSRVHYHVVHGVRQVQHLHVEAAQPGNGLALGGHRGQEGGEGLLPQPRGMRLAVPREQLCHGLAAADKDGDGADGHSLQHHTPGARGQRREVALEEKGSLPKVLLGPPVGVGTLADLLPPRKRLVQSKESLVPTAAHLGARLHVGLGEGGRRTSQNERSRGDVSLAHLEGALQHRLHFLPRHGVAEEGLAHHLHVGIPVHRQVGSAAQQGTVLGRR